MDKDGKPKTGKGDKEKPEPTRIDLENLDQRILALPIPARNYVGLAAGKEGILFLLEASQPGPPAFKGMIAHKFDLSKRKVEKVLEEASFEAPSLKGQALKVDGAWVKQRLDPVLKDEDLSRYIL